jgi:hypothetical protein
MNIWILIGELIVLYFLSRRLTQALFELFLFIFRSRTIAITILLVLQFPGTVIHELAHLFTAEILRVPTGKMTLVPESIRESNIKSGSVMIAKTDPFRRYAIGLAPISAGIIVITAISYFLPGLWESIQFSSIPLWEHVHFYWILIASYGLFSVSNAMFSSPEDLKGFPPFAFVLAILAIGAYFLGLRFTLTGNALEVSLRTLVTLTNSLGLVIILNIVLLAVSWGLKLLWMKLFHLRFQKEQ